MCSDGARGGLPAATARRGLLLQVVDEGSGEPVGEEGGEGIPEGGGVVEVGQVGEFVGEDLFQHEGGEEGEGAVESDFALPRAVAQNARTQGGNLNRGGLTGELRFPAGEEGAGPLQEGFAPEGFQLRFEALRIEGAFAEEHGPVAFEPKVVVAGEGDGLHGAAAVQKDELPRSRQTDLRRAETLPLAPEHGFGRQRVACRQEEAGFAGEGEEVEDGLAEDLGRDIAPALPEDRQGVAFKGFDRKVAEGSEHGGELRIMNDE